jgi:CrcB protein
MTPAPGRSGCAASEAGILWRFFFATGFLGAYTTFSTYTCETAYLLRASAYGLALLYLFGSMLLDMVGVLAGILAAERL